MLYVLDIDDTIYLERDYVRSGFCVVGRWLAENQNIEDFFEYAWGLFESGVRGNVFDMVLEEMGIYDKQLVINLVDLYRRHNPKISLSPDAINFLKRHEKRDLAIISDGYSCTQWAKIRALNLEQFIDKIIVTDDWGKEFWKPNSRGYIEVQGHADPRECIYIGDNPQKDFIAPRQLDWAPSIRIRRKLSLHYELDTPDIYCEISTLDDIV